MNFRFTIGRKLSLGFGVLVIAILINGILTYVTLKRGKQFNDKITNTYTPSIEHLKDLNLLILQSKNLIVDWLEDEKQDTPEKIRLERLHDYDYPELRKKLKGVMVNWQFKEQMAMDSIFHNIDSLFEVQHEVMVTFSSEEDYRDLGTVFRYLSSFQYGKLNKYVTGTVENLNALIKTQSSYAQSLSIEMLRAFNVLQSYVTYLGFFLVLGGVLIAYFTIRSIVNPLDKLKDALTTMGRGVLPNIRLAKRTDEIGEMTTALGNLVSGLKRTSDFANEIGNGNFKSTFVPLSSDDTLGVSLLLMRDNLALVSEDDRKRNWTTGGLAKFGEILRKSSDNVKYLSESLVSELVKYLEANQGGIFIVNNEDSDDVHLELTGCYAWDRIKYLDQSVYKGDGLVGQSWQETRTLYITDIPEDYIKITSGLGDSNPTCLLIVPMIVNDEFFGVIELASFNEFEEYQIKFVEKVAETTAGTISAVKVNQKTKELLERAQNATKQMRAKEEEMEKEQDLMENRQTELEQNLNKVSKDLEVFNKKNIQLEEENHVLQNLLLKASKELDLIKNNKNLN